LRRLPTAQYIHNKTCSLEENSISEEATDLIIHNIFQQQNKQVLVGFSAISPNVLLHSQMPHNISHSLHVKPVSSVVFKQQ
jgi:hypothetical protein